MSGGGGPAHPSVVPGCGLLNKGGACRHKRAMPRSRVLVHTFLLSSSVLPQVGTGGGEVIRSPVRLPSLPAATAPRSRQTVVVPLSFSGQHPPTHTAAGEQRVVHEGFFSRRRHSSLAASPLSPTPPLPPPPPHIVIGGGRPSPPATGHHPPRSPSYSHFSRAVRPQARTPPRRAVAGDLRPLATQQQQHRHSLALGEEALSVTGRRCLPGWGRPATLVARGNGSTVAGAAGMGRTQLHVFLPTEGGGGEAGEGDSESVDEGFMDELDSRIASVKPQQGAPETVTSH